MTVAYKWQLYAQQLADCVCWVYIVFHSWLSAWT